MADRVLLVAAHEGADRAVKRGGEQQRLGLTLDLLQDALHLWQEAHVRHLVGLVDDDERDSGE